MSEAHRHGLSIAKANKYLHNVQRLAKDCISRPPMYAFLVGNMESVIMSTDEALFIIDDAGAEPTDPITVLDRASLGELNRLSEQVFSKIRDAELSGCVDIGSTTEIRELVVNSEPELKAVA